MPKSCAGLYGRVTHIALTLALASVFADVTFVSIWKVLDQERPDTPFAALLIGLVGLYLLLRAPGLAKDVLSILKREMNIERTLP